MSLKNKTWDPSLHLEKGINTLCSDFLMHFRVIFMLTQQESNWISSERKENIFPTLKKKNKKNPEPVDSRAGATANVPIFEKNLFWPHF